jgi:hypothetical protein
MGTTVKRIPGNGAGWAGVDLPFARIRDQAAQVAIETFMATIDDSDIHGVGIACSSFLGSRLAPERWPSH